MTHKQKENSCIQLAQLKVVLDDRYSPGEKVKVVLDDR